MRWHSPPDWTGNDTSSGDDSSPLRGQLSIRMQKEGSTFSPVFLLITIHPYLSSSRVKNILVVIFQVSFPLQILRTCS